MNWAVMAAIKKDEGDGDNGDQQLAFVAFFQKIGHCHRVDFAGHNGEFLPKTARVK